MKIGPLNISLEEKQAQVRGRKPRFDEVGSTGTAFISGHLAEEEYNSELQGEKGRLVYDKMRRSDAQVKATLLVCQLPLRAGTWSIETASDEKQDVEIAEFIEDNLFKGMTITWDDFLRHVLLMLSFGFSPFEKVFELRDDRIAWRKLAPRLPKTLYEWSLDNNGGLQGMTQFVWKGNAYEFVTIPVEKMLVFTNEREGSNYEGVSILRAVYKHWYYKDHLYRIDAISAERHATGIPKFTHPATADDDAKNKLDVIGARLYAMEQMFVRLSEGYDMTIEGLTGSIRDIMPSIQHHNREIPKAILAHFLELGAENVGSYAMSRDQSSFFLMALKATAKNISDTVNRYAIRQLVDYNWPGVKAYPVLKCGGLETRNMKEYSEAVTGLIREGALSYDEGLEATLRDMLDMPEKPEGAQPRPRTAQPEPVRTSEKIITTTETKWRRDLTPVEQLVSFGEIENTLDSATDIFVQAVKDTQIRQIENLVEAVMSMIENRQMDKLLDAQVRYQTQMADQMMTVLREVFGYGRKQVKQEIAAQRKTQLAEGELLPLGVEELAAVMAYLKAKAKASTSTLANKLRTAATFEGLRQIKAGVADRAVLMATLTDLSDRELQNTAARAVNEAFGYGRGVQAERQSGDIERVQYSSILDGNTCEMCALLDGQEWDYDDPRTVYYASGNPDCLGGDRCRCVLIYIAAAEAKAVR